MHRCTTHAAIKNNARSELPCENAQGCRSTRDESTPPEQAHHSDGRLAGPQPASTLHLPRALYLVNLQLQRLALRPHTPPLQLKLGFAGSSTAAQAARASATAAALPVL